MARKTSSSKSHKDANVISFAATMTVMLAFFIVLSSLAGEQTGGELYKGTGSFVRALNSFGLAGLFRKGSSAQAIKLEASRPVYHTEVAGEVGREGVGPDDAAELHRVFDFESERWQRFLQDMEDAFDLEQLPRTTGTATFDIFEPLGKSPPYLSQKHSELLAQISHLARHRQYRVLLVVWATTPSPSAWRRAALQARGAADELAAITLLDPAARERLIPIGQPWRFPKKKRPALSVIVTKAESTP